MKYDIYITGSNAFLLSSDLSTLFTGRTMELEVFPFSYKEYLQYIDLNDSFEAFDDYVMLGGMPGSYLYHERDQKYQYIASVFDTIILRDLKIKNKIRNGILLERISSFLLDNIANLSSARSIANALRSNSIEANDKTVGSYINYLCHAFVFYRMRRYDIKGKKYLSSSEKYYVSDHSFRYAKLGTKHVDYGRTYENIIAIELLRRGYEVYVGVLYKKEIDFVAIKRNEKIYIQVADNISQEETFKREVSPLLSIKDAYPKLLIARTRHDEYAFEGVKIIDISKWLAD
jgi:predicted AAA+ superfamily ATPase